MTTQTILFSVEEQNGLCDFERFTCKVNEDAKSMYLKSRKIQSEKGFKRPMPLSVSIENVYINVKG